MVSYLEPRGFLGRLIMDWIRLDGKENDNSCQFQFPKLSKAPATFMLSSCLSKGPAIKFLRDPWGSQQLCHREDCSPEWIMWIDPLLNTALPRLAHLTRIELLDLILSLWLHSLVYLELASWNRRQTSFPRKAWLLSKELKKPRPPSQIGDVKVRQLMRWIFCLPTKASQKKFLMCLSISKQVLLGNGRHCI